MRNTPQEIQLAYLERCVRDYKIFIDTSSLLAEESDKFLQNIVPILEREHKAMILPKSVGLELMKLANDLDYCRSKYPNNPDLNARAVQACKNVNALINAGLIQVFADPDDGVFADQIFLNVFMKKRLQYNMLLITQDRSLAEDIIKIGRDSRSVQGIKKIVVEHIGRNGYLQKIFNNRENRQPDSVNYTVTAQEEIPEDERFPLSREIIDIKGMRTVSKIPTTGDIVCAVRSGRERKFRLLEEVGKGGEGSVYRTEIDGYVAKIYKPEKLTNQRYEKLKFMLTKDINCEGVCFPFALIYNENDEFVGYLMREASGKDLGKSIFMPMLLKKYFPSWTRVETVQLCVTILQKLKYLHDRNVILGDINPYNILVVSPTEVYFVDTDSWQVGGYACPVGMALFTAPELQGKKFGTFLRTLANENFAVATLLFMIMHPGKPPYAMTDGLGITENIMNGEFSYPLGERKTGKVPKGPWRYCWSHLTYKIKETFYETFWREGVYHDEGKRPGTGHWLRLFGYYLRLLQDGKMSAQDEEALQIFPTRFKMDRNKKYAPCKICGKKYDEETLEQGICRSCLNEGDHYHCARCGREMVYTNYQKLVKRAKRYEICHDCYEAKNTIWERRNCRECDRPFDITLGQKEFFDSKGLELPTRCENCRGSSKSNFNNYNNTSFTNAFTNTQNSPRTNNTLIDRITNIFN